MEYKFKINNFEGPLDLLLHLIKESKMDIVEIKIVELTNQYLDYVNMMENLNLTIASEYLVLAAELIELKSKFLLPKTDNEEDKDEYEEAKEDLVNRLVEYQKYKEMTKNFEKLEDGRRAVYTKTPSSLKEYCNKEIVLNGDVSLNDLLQAFQKVLDRNQLLKPINTKITVKEVSVEDRINNIRQILSKEKKVEFTKLFDNFTKTHVVVTFLAILELAKENEIIIVQENNFDKIYCEVLL